TLARRHSVSEALEQYQAVLKLPPDYVAARLALAELLAASGKPEDALAQLQEVLKRKPQDALAYERIGDVEKARGHTAEARAAYQEALRYAPDSQVRKKSGAKMKRGQRGLEVSVGGPATETGRRDESRRGRHECLRHVVDEQPVGLRPWRRLSACRGILLPSAGRSRRRRS